MKGLGAEGRIILIAIDKKWDGGGVGINSIDLAEEMNRQRALVSAVVNLRVT